MAFFQNLMVADFVGNWVLDDRQYSPSFRCPRNSGRGDEIVVAWGEPDGEPNTPRTYNLSGSDTNGAAHDVLKIRYAVGGSFLDWNTLSINITDNTNAGLSPVPSPAAMRVDQIVSILNTHSGFKAYFTASVGAFGNDREPKDRLTIKQKFPATRMKFYIINGQAEEVLKFNYRAGVAELPSYFARHTVFNRATDGSVAFSDGVNMLIELHPSTSDIDADIIDNAVNEHGISMGYDHTSVQQDWQLLSGKSPTFMFKKVVSGSETIEYPAGAKAGDLGKKTLVSGGNTFIIPYTLASGDLITPP